MESDGFRAYNPELTERMPTVLIPVLIAFSSMRVTVTNLNMSMLKEMKKLRSFGWTQFDCRAVAAFRELNFHGSRRW
jgi:hypothetical protein